MLRVQRRLKIVKMLYKNVNGNILFGFVWSLEMIMETGAPTGCHVQVLTQKNVCGSSNLVDKK